MDMEGEDFILVYEGSWVLILIINDSWIFLGCGQTQAWMQNGVISSHLVSCYRSKLCMKILVCSVIFDSCWFTSWDFHLSTLPSIHPPIHQSFQTTSLSASQPASIHLFTHGYLPTHLSIYSSIHLSLIHLYPFIHPVIIHQSIASLTHPYNPPIPTYPSIHLST